MIKAVTPMVSFKANPNNLPSKQYIQQFENKVLSGINTDKAKEILRDEFSKMGASSQKRFLGRLFDNSQLPERFLSDRNECVFQFANKLYKISQNSLKSITAKLAAPSEERNLIEIYKLRLQDPPTL